MAAAAILLGGAGGLLFGFFALVSLVAFNVVYIVILAPILYAFWQLIRWGFSKYALRFEPAFYSGVSILRRTLMAAFLAGLLRLMFDLARAEKGVEVGDIDGVYAVLFVLVGAILGAGGAAYNNMQHRRRASAQAATAE